MRHRWTESGQRRVLVAHNLVWSRYKAVVFSELHLLSGEDVSYEFVQVAETDNERQVLSVVDNSFHRYPFTLLNKGSFDAVSPVRVGMQLVRHVIRQDPDLVLIAGYHKLAYWMLLVAARLRRRRVGVFSDSTIHDHPQHWYKNFAKRIFLKQCDCYFTYGEPSRSYLEALGANPERIFIRRQAAALPDGYSPVDALARRQALAATVDPPRFLYVGRLSSEKGLETLFQAFGEYRRLYATGELILCGNGPLRPQLEQQAANIGVDVHTQFRGGLEPTDLAGEYGQATCLILPSWSEPWGLVVNEALHYGCPVIVSDLCGCAPDLVEGKQTGFTFRPGDGNVLLAQMKSLSAESPDQRMTRSTACLSAIAGFDPQNSSKQIDFGVRRTLNLPYRYVTLPTRAAPATRIDSA